ncbi:MAG: heat-inducible transcriptional repressor HrcA [Bacteroidota bacterium]|jgi:heat-inducible transcriptional repressor|nr:heat-inducible transcriptional repressor HrcA [Bacteroidota bacterium]
MNEHDAHIEETGSLSERERQVLLYIVEQFVTTATPIGSRTLSKLTDLNLSPASIRNVMADLEERGLIGHPHTSAGRVPTDRGYRYYVDSIMPQVQLSDNEQHFLQSRFEQEVPAAIHELLRTSSHILSRISQQLAIVAAPSLGRGVLQRLELVQVATDKVMVILSIRSGIVKSIVLHIRSEISRQKLDQVGVLLNERLAGLTLAEIRETFVDRMREAEADEAEIIRLFIDSSDRLFSERLETDAVCIDGMMTMTAQPEFDDPGRMRGLIELVENQRVIVHLLDSLSGGQSVTIRIGREINDDTLSDYSLIAAPYRFGQLDGTLSIIGPKRMNYPRMIAIVDYLARLMST